MIISNREQPVKGYEHMGTTIRPEPVSYTHLDVYKRQGFEESEHWYDHLKKHIGWQSLGKVLCGYVTHPGDIEGK